MNTVTRLKQDRPRPWQRGNHMTNRRLEVLQKLAATPEGVEVLDALFGSFAGPTVDHRIGKLVAAAGVRDLALEYLELVQTATRRSRT